MKFFNLRRPFFVVLTLAVGLVRLAMAQDFTISSPNNGDVLGKTNQLKFNINNVSSQAKIVATTVNQANPSTSFRVEGTFDPDSNNKISGNLDLNFDQTTPSGLYNITVQYFQQGSVLTTRTISNVNIDTTSPKFRNVTPLTSAFVKGIVPILAELDEANVDLWTVKVNSSDIPNNTGSSSLINVLWDTGLITRDGSQSISIDVKDKGKNSSNRSLSVTLDRVPPSTAIRSPSTIGYRQGATIPVQIDVDDQFAGSVTANGIIVTLKTLDGQFIQRVARRGVRQNGNGVQWVGRILKTSKIPSTFKMIVVVNDRAGNAALTQEVTVRYGN
ncbi:MAG: hypothetical protein K8R88_06845 [Armatimonadetes bacterium]|nr:hypothetical protein [Armatimonadota bacterium]